MRFVWAIGGRAKKGWTRMKTNGMAQRDMSSAPVWRADREDAGGRGKIALKNSMIPPPVPARVAPPPFRLFRRHPGGRVCAPRCVRIADLTGICAMCPDPCGDNLGIGRAGDADPDCASLRDGLYGDRVLSTGAYRRGAIGAMDAGRALSWQAAARRARHRRAIGASAAVSGVCDPLGGGFSGAELAPLDGVDGARGERHEHALERDDPLRTGAGGLVPDHLGYGGIGRICDDFVARLGPGVAHPTTRRLSFGKP